MSISAVAVILLFQLQDMELTPETAKLDRAEVAGRVCWGLGLQAPLDMGVNCG